MNDYWTGIRRAQLHANQVTAAWAARRSDGSHELMMVNKAFEIFFNSRRLIQQCRDANLRTQMTRDLETAARTGAGFGGPDDLEEAFEHLVANRGAWTDGATESYYGAERKAYSGAALVKGPKSVVNFLDAVDDRMEKLRECAEEFVEQVRVITGSQRDRTWERVGDALEEINDGGGKVKHLLWYAPSIEVRVEGVLSITDVLSNIHEGLTDYANLTGRGLRPDQAVAGIAFKRAIGMVPVLGDFYKKAFDMIPHLRDWFVQLLGGYLDRIDRVTHDHR